MDAKGPAVDSIKKWVLANHPGDYSRWLESLSPASQAIFRGLVLSTEWYPAREGLIEPSLAVCRLFFGGEIQGAWQLGRFSGRRGLNGIYKMLVRFASPDVLIDKSIKVLSNYYRPLEASVDRVGPGHVSLRISGLDEPSQVIDHRIAGWSEAGFEICRAKNVVVRVARSAARVGDYSQIDVTWS